MSFYYPFISSKVPIPPSFCSFFSWSDRKCGLLGIGNSEGSIGVTLRYIDKGKQMLTSELISQRVCKYNRDWFYSVICWCLTLWENFYLSRKLMIYWGALHTLCLLLLNALQCFGAWSFFKIWSPEHLHQNCQERLV